MVNLDRDVKEIKNALADLNSRVSALEIKKTAKAEPKKSKSEE